MSKSPSLVQLCDQVVDAALSPLRRRLRFLGARKSQFEKYQNTLGPLLNGRYQRYANECRTQVDDTCDEAGVRSQGSVLVKSIMSTEDALALSRQVGVYIGADETGNVCTGQLMEKVAKPVTELGRSVIDIFYNSELDSQIRGFFGSYYRVQWLDCYRSFPTDDVSSSWLWHSDNVPVETLKVMLHLTDAGAEQGATNFMNMSDTLEYYRAGYRGHTSKRVEDLEGFANQRGLPYRPFHHEARAGDVMLFNNNALHRAVPPKQDYRDVLTYLLLPNPIPWDQQLEQDGIATVESNPGGFPRMPWLPQAA